VHALKTGFKNIVLLSLIFLIVFGLGESVNARSGNYSCPYARKRIGELFQERDRIVQGFDPWGRGDPISREEKDRMIRVIDARIEGFRRDDRIYSQNKRDDTTANNNAKRVEEAREAREWNNNYNREMNQIARDYLDLNDADRNSYRSQLSPEQQSVLDRFVNQQNQAAAQAAGSQSSGLPGGSVSTGNFTPGSTTISSNLINGVTGAFIPGGATSLTAGAGTTPAYDPSVIRDESEGYCILCGGPCIYGAPVSGPGQTEDSDLDPGTESDPGTGSEPGTGPDPGNGSEPGTGPVPYTGEPGTGPDPGTDQTGGSDQTGNSGSGQTGGSDQTGGSGSNSGQNGGSWWETF